CARRGSYDDYHWYFFDYW
nr:immunoglobulin heavy chain junction region [Mus musculus]